MSLQGVLQQRITSAQGLLQRAELLCGGNLTHLTAIVESLQSVGGVVSLLHVFRYRDAAGCSRSLLVDVVADGGLTWVKAVGRKAEALHNIWQGGGQYGDKSIISQAQDFLSASRQQEVQYRHPHVVFAFYNGVSSPMVQRLRDMGVAVRGDIVAVNAMMAQKGEKEEEPFGEEEEPEEEEAEGEEPEEEEGPEEEGLDEEPEEGEEPDGELSLPRVQRGRVLARLSFPAQLQPQSCGSVNLDITTLISYVSALSHGACRGKQLFACAAAVTDFRLILDTLGGPGEKQRAEKLLQRLQLVEDQPSQRTLRLTLSNKVNQRSISIFGTGDSLRAVTMTANSRFVRAAANQGIRYNVFIHQPRALTEGKEWRATPL
ncbi:hypothetical protein PBY51_022009 [Eleginops maclovinus]|uniref:CG025 protein n=1 Tax=Eleginops maclovinus TaxID=56733 RepID=A0AAN8AMQ3_ELEMC|nr:hypothetical protein PBY51_022009 [Eleginops maclovinus]